MIPLPETPRYLVEKGRNAEAANVLDQLIGGDATIDAEEVVFQRRRIESSLEIESAGKPFRYAKLFKGGVRSRTPAASSSVALRISCNSSPALT
jgi:hypothetical protein